MESEEGNTEERENREFIDFFLNFENVEPDEKMKEIFSETGRSAPFMREGMSEREQESYRKRILKDKYTEDCMKEGTRLVYQKEENPCKRRENLKNAFMLLQKASTIQDNYSDRSNDLLGRSNNPLLAEVYSWIGYIYYMAPNLVPDYTNDVNKTERIYELALGNYFEVINIYERCYEELSPETEKKQRKDILYKREKAALFASNLAHRLRLKQNESCCETMRRKISELGTEISTWFTGGYKRVPSSDPYGTQESPDPVNVGSERLKSD